MKKLIGFIVVAAMFVLTGCDGFSPDIQNNSLIEPDHEYELDTWMENSEVYEFTPRNNTDYTCIMLMLDSGSDMGLQCFPKMVGNKIPMPPL